MSVLWIAHGGSVGAGAPVIVAPPLKSLRRGTEKPRPAAVVNAGHAMARNAAVVWNFAEGGGTIAQNAVVGGTNGTIATPVWKRDGLAPDGTNGSVSTGTVPALADWLTLGVTVFVRFRNFAANSNKRLFSLGASPGEELTVYGSSGTLQTTNLGGAGFAFTTATTADDKTHELALVVVPRASDRLLRIYLDGVHLSDTAQAAAFTPTTNVYVARYSGGGFVWEGVYECVHIMRAALTSDEVMTHWHRPYDIMTPRLAR